MEQLALVAQDLLQLSVAQATNPALNSALRRRLDGPLHQSLTRLATLAQLREWDSAADTAEAQRYANTRLEEARYLAQSMHRELQAALTEPR